MRIAKNTTVTLTEAPSARFLLVVDVMDGALALSRDGETLLSLSLVGDDVLADITYPDGHRITLVGEAARGKEVILTAGYARVGLYVGGVLWDEDFFFTPLDYLGATLTAGSFSHFEAGYEYHAMSESAIVENLTDRLDGYRLAGREHAPLRVLPTVINGRIYLHYLDSRHGGNAKGARGAHVLRAMFSDDGVRFHGAPTALFIDNVRENSILDAALLCEAGRFYLYYLVAYPHGTALSCAVSEDGFSYRKTGLDIEIEGVHNKNITAISVSHAPTPLLFFTCTDRTFVAESIDLLHFAAPRPLPLFDGMEKVIPLQGEKNLFFAQKGRTLYIREGESLIPVRENGAYPILFGNKISYIGIRGGAFGYEK